jgi:hypothetical protein
MANIFNCIYIHDNTNIKTTWEMTDRDKILAYFERIHYCVSQIKEEYFMMLEDDVVVLRRITEPLLGDLNGNGYNTFHINFLKQFPELKEIHENVVYSGHGGSIWKTKRFLEFTGNRKLIEDVLDKWQTIYHDGSSDNIASFLCLVSGGKIHRLESHKDRLTDNVRNLESVAVLHQCQELYSKQKFPDDVIY